MSDKRKVTTFRLMLVQPDKALEGPIVSPDKRRVAESFAEVHAMLRQDQGLLVHDREWIYLPSASILAVRRGTRFFTLPWPLVDDPESSEETPAP